MRMSRRKTSARQNEIRFIGPHRGLAVPCAISIEARILVSVQAKDLEDKRKVRLFPAFPDTSRAGLPFGKPALFISSCHEGQESFRFCYLGRMVSAMSSERWVTLTPALAFST